ncbi:GNAT family N-acetyltransferase [Arthrobacter sp. ERGS1:01]|uniref:GNAT family N-acetyltransferase n=1 Tax=Arthrobacter sp. ERGS1:01 TaxID=1704044 RepID=UPI000A450AA5|nr:GNAT family protein [Arthrobacter sp. ERGS1:01]
MLEQETTAPYPVLDDGPVLLRRLTDHDAAAFAAIHHDPLNVKWTAADAAMTPERAAALIAGPIADGWRNGDLLRFAVVERRDGAENVVGTLSLQDVRRTDHGGAAAVGIKMLASGRGRGSATRAVELACGYAYGVLGLEVLHWRTTVGNTASRALAERCGFALAAEIPGFGQVDGRITDGWMFSQGVASWQARGDSAYPEAVSADAAAVAPAAAETLDIEAVVPRLSDGDVVLRALCHADAEQLVLNCVNEDAVRWTTVPLGYTREHADYFINTLTVDGWRNREVLTFAVADSSTDTLLGTVDLQCKHPGAASIGINFGTHARGTGAAEKAVRLVADYAFNELNLSFLHWHALAPNWGSRKLAWKLGFTFHGEIRGDYNDRGTPADRWILSLAAGDARTPQGPWTGPAPLKR